MTLYTTQYTTHFLFSLSLLLSAPALSANWFDMDEAFADMEQQMHRMRQEMLSMQESMQKAVAQQCKATTKKALSARITTDAAATNIIITVNNLHAESVDAQIDDSDGILRITTPGATIKIASRNTIIALDIDETIQKQEDTKKDGTGCSYFSAQSKSYTKEQLVKPIELEKAKVDYNPEVPQLIITIPYVEVSKANGKKVPVTFAKSPEKQEPVCKK